MSAVLIVEDDPVLGRGLSVNLELAGFTVSWARELSTAEACYRDKKPDLILLDLNLPDGNGLTLLQKIRGEKSQTAVIILTAQTDEDSVVEGLQCGANDYMRKPFGHRELLAHMKAVLKEPVPQAPQTRYGDLLILATERRILYGEQPLELNRREFDILTYLIANAEAVVTRARLLEILGAHEDIFDRTIDSHVSHIRSRLRQANVNTLQISSVYGVGYRLEKRA
jgi:DNA-binding response OmpR family regulator